MDWGTTVEDEHTAVPSGASVVKLVRNPGGSDGFVYSSVNTSEVNAEMVTHAVGYLECRLNHGGNVIATRSECRQTQRQNVRLTSAGWAYDPITTSTQLVGEDYDFSGAGPGTAATNIVYPSLRPLPVGMPNRGFDCWKGGASGCTYTFSTTGGVTSINITAGSLQQVLEGKNLRSGTHVLSWSGTAQGKIGGGSYSASGVTASVTGGTNLTIEFNAGTLSNVQLEEGSTATPFSTRLFATELALCKRYHPIFLAVGTATQFIATAFAFSGSGVSVAFQFEVEPRVPPTGLAVSAASHFNINAGGGGAGAATAVTFNSASPKAGRLLATPPGAITAGGGAEFFAAGTDGAYLYFTGASL